MKELLHGWNQYLANQKEPFRRLDEISSEVYDYVVDAAKDLEESEMSPVFGGQERVLIPMMASDNEEIQNFYDYIVTPLAAKGFQVNLEDGTATQEVETRVGKRERKTRLGKTIGKELPETVQKWWNKFQANFLGNPDVLNTKYAVVISQHPVDVLRMSDFGPEGIQSCHSEGSDYFRCAIADAMRAGAIAYLIDGDDYKEAEEHLGDHELFADRDRGVSGIRPIARVRLRRLDNPKLATQGKPLALLVPETRIYGKSVPGFLNTVITWARDIQKSHPVFSKKLWLGNFVRRGGSYSDSSEHTMFNNLIGMENMELSDELEMYGPSESANVSDDEDNIDFVGEDRIEQIIGEVREAMYSLESSYLDHEDVKTNITIEWDEWNEMPEVNLSIDFEFDFYLEDGMIKAPMVGAKDEEEAFKALDRVEPLRTLTRLAETAYEDSEWYVPDAHIEDWDAGIRRTFDSTGKAMLRIYGKVESWGNNPEAARELIEDVSNVVESYDNVKEAIINSMMEDGWMEETPYGELLGTTDEEEEIIAGKQLKNFKVDAPLTRTGVLTVAAFFELDNYPVPGPRKDAKFGSEKPFEYAQSPTMADIFGWSDRDWKNMKSTIYLRKQGVQLAPVHSKPMINSLSDEIMDAAQAAHKQLELPMAGLPEKEKEDVTPALNTLDSIKFYLYPQTFASSQYSGNAPTYKAMGAVVIAFEPSTSEKQILQNMTFLTYFDKHVDVIERLLQKQWDIIVKEFETKQPLLSNDDPDYKNLSGQNESKTVSLLRGLIKESLQEELKISSNPDRDMIMSAIGDPNFLVSFTDVQKVGINPRTNFNTPAGIYGWHWTKNIVDRASKNKIFGSKRPYAQLLKIKEGAKVLWLGDDDKTGDVPSQEEMNTAIAKKYPAFVKDTFPVYEVPDTSKPSGSDSQPKYIMAGNKEGDRVSFVSPKEWLEDPKHVETLSKVSIRNYGGDTESEKVYDYIQAAAKALEIATDKKITLLSNGILRAIGYDAVIDANSGGIIHKNEVSQGFFTHKGGLDHVATIDNSIYSLPSTSAFKILVSPGAPAEKIEQAIDSVIELGQDLGADPESGVKFDIHDKLDFLDYAVQKNMSLEASHLWKIYNFVKNISDSGKETFVSTSILQHMLAHPNIPQVIFDDAGKKLLNKGDKEYNDKYVVMHMLANPKKATPEFLVSVVNGAAGYSTDVLQKAMMNPNMPTDVLTKYIKPYFQSMKTVSDHKIARAALQNPNAPATALLDLLYDEDGNIESFSSTFLAEIIRAPSLPEESLYDIFNNLKKLKESRKILMSDIVDSFLMSETVPDDIIINVLDNYEDYTSVFVWKNFATDLLWKTLTRKGPGVPISKKVRDHIAKTLDKIQKDPEFDVTPKQAGAIEKEIEIQSAKPERKSKNESKNIKSILRSMIAEQVQILVSDKKPDVKEVAKAVIYSGDQVLLIKRSEEMQNFPGYWDLPGGHLVEGETLEEGLVREVFEETSIKIKDPVKLYNIGDETFYKAEMPESDIKLSFEHTGHKFANLSDVPGHDDMSPKYKDVVLEALDEETLSENKIISEMFVKGDPEGNNIVAYRQNIWRLQDEVDEETKEEINQALSVEDDWDDVRDLQEILEDAKRSDVLVGGLNWSRPNYLHLERVGSFFLDPKSSILVKKVVKELGASGVTYMPSDAGDEQLSHRQLRGKIPDIMYHGTTTDYIPGLLKFGLVPGEKETNYEGISHPDAVFFSSRFDEALHHAAHTAGKVGGDPMVVALRIPDKALMIPDYDVDVGSGDTGCYDYICQSLRDRQRGDLDVDSFSLSREVGVYGYKGRIPASFLQEYNILMNAQEQGLEMWDVTEADFASGTPEEAGIYYETKREFGYGSFEEPEYDDEDEDEEEEW
jgi:8-oxo-dGTP pyrophosphatase MutT (NUDIX family)